MVRQEPKNDIIIAGLENRLARAQALNQQKQFQYERAIQVVRSFPGNITKASQLKR
jgi:hypothetical protein